MSTTDTFIIPPVDAAAEQKTNNSQPKKKSRKGKWAILIGLVILIISLPIGVYYFSQQQQITDTRSRASGNSCSTLGATMCQGQGVKLTGWLCTCVDDGSKVWSCGKQDLTKCPVGGTNGGGGGGGGGGGVRTEEGKFHKCGYLRNTGGGGQAQSSCDSTNCGDKPCGVFTYKCGKYCLDTSCGSKACYDDPVTTPTATIGPTATVEPTAEPTAEPTNPPAEPGQCDASCGSDANCESGLSCASVDGTNRCRKAECPAQSNCSCATPTDVPVDTTEPDVNGQAMPVSGIGPGIFGSITAIGSILLLVVGLVL